MRAGRSRCAGLLLSTPKRRPRCRLCFPRQGEMRRNHRAQQRTCGRAAPLGSPQSCPWAPHRCPWHAPASISVLPLSAELFWGLKASGQVILCSPCSGASAWAPALPRGLAVSQRPQTFSVCGSERDAVTGHGDPLPACLTSEGTGLGAGLAGSLRNTLQPPGPPSLGPLTVSCSLLPSGAATDLQRSPRSYAWPCSVFWFLCDLNPVDTFVQVR